MIYREPFEPSRIFNETTAATLDGMVFFGDNFAGWILGFDTRDDWRIVGVDRSRRKPNPQKAQTIAEFVAELLARD
jgi:hypothetical protein